jgi:histidyl-tRNA synthetase
MIQLIRGFKDILPGEVELWQAVEAVARQLLEDFGFKEIRIPIMERTELVKIPTLSKKKCTPLRIAKGI